MEPIINPLLFYYIDVLGNIKFWISTLVFIGTILAILGGFLFLLSFDSAKDDVSAIKYRRYYKFFIIGYFIVVVINIFMPTQETLYKMAISSYITPDNVNMVINKTGEVLELSATKLVDIITDGAVKIIESTK